MANPIAAVKGTRDFYPEEFAPVSWIIETWRRVSRRHGFAEYEGPTLEQTDLYTRKSGEEIVEQLFTLTDRGGRSLALRPEMTPTLARMVAARAGSLPRPIKWFCVPRMYRGERPQRGRLREFYQWNIDILGVSGVVADAECILVGVEALRELGLRAEDFAFHISDRRLVGAILRGFGVPEEGQGAAFAILDKAGKLPEEEVGRRWVESLGRYVEFGRLWDVMSAEGLEGVERALGGGSGMEAIGAVRALCEVLQNFGIMEFCKIDLRVVRGLAYYTGVVFEAYDRAGALRALCGGGRYDDLLATVGGRPLPGVGFGMGDVVLLELLTELKRVPAFGGGGGVFVIDAVERGTGARTSAEVLRVVGGLRRAGYAAEFAYEPQTVGKQMKRAAERGASHVVFVGRETQERGVVSVKEMKSGTQREVAMRALLDDPAGVLGPPHGQPA